MNRYLRMVMLAGGATVAGSLLALAFTDDVPPRASPLTGPRTDLPATAEAPAVAATGNPAAPVSSAPGATAPAVAPAAVAVSSSGPAALAATAPERPPSGPGSAAYQAAVESRLTRRLQGEHPLRIDGVDFEILGTQLPRDGQESEPYLAVRNVRTGEVAHWQSGLRFAVRPGVDPETFIAQQPGMRRLFVNAQFAEVAVDAALISAVYARLAADPRLSGVRLLPIATAPTVR